MSIKYEYLEELRNSFIKVLQEETKKANNEDDMEYLASIAEDALCAIPVELIQKDYWTRNTIATRLPEEKQQDTSFINGLMKYIYNEDAIYFGDYVIENIDECIDEYVEQQGEEKDANQTLAEALEEIQSICIGADSPDAQERTQSDPKTELEYCQKDLSAISNIVERLLQTMEA